MTKTLLIGWEAADWKVISPRIDAGEMPTLGHPIEHGVMGNLATLYPVLSPMLWTRIATGKRAPNRHRIHGFSDVHPEAPREELAERHVRPRRRGWKPLPRGGRRSATIGRAPKPVSGFFTVSNR